MDQKAAENKDSSEKTESLVYSREEYAKKEFWNDRFKEQNGFFDWYANWKEIKPKFNEMLKNNLDNTSSDMKLSN